MERTVVRRCHARVERQKVGSRNPGGGPVLRWHLPYVQRDTRLLATVDGDVNGVLARLFKFQLLDVDEEIARDKIRVGRQRHLDGHVDAPHHEATVFVHEVHFYSVMTLFDAAEDDAQGDRTLGVYGGQLVGDNRVEGPQQIELSAVIGR